MMKEGKVFSLEDRMPKMKEHRKRKANRRLISLISLFFLLILLVIYFQSSLSHINKIKIVGNELISEEEAIEKSGLEIGTNVWRINRKATIENLQALQEVKSAQVKWKFPNTVYLTLQEYETIAYVSTDKTFHPILENGRTLKSKLKESEVPVSAPILSGFNETSILKEMAKQLEQLPAEILNAISEIHHQPKKTDQYHINLFMNDGFEVSATILTFSEKMEHYPSFVAKLDPNIKGVIDLEVGSFFKAYEQEGETLNEEEFEE